LTSEFSNYLDLSPNFMEERMSQQVSANYTMPTVLNSLKPSASGGTAKSNATTSPTTGSTTSSSTTSLGSTFLSLLATELQNQDPTAPVDSTAMVGQMISLNQLDQLISINQTIGGATDTTSSTGGVQPASDILGASTSGTAGNSLSPSAQVVAMQSQLPFDPNTMMPVGSALGNSNAVSNSINSQPATIGSPNAISGGK
jgi:flagellar basal-body rod modification protein FlgD